MISEQTFPHREAVDHAATEQRDADKRAIAEYLLKQSVQHGGYRMYQSDAATEAEEILRLLGR